MKLEDIAQIVQDNPNAGGSGTGASYWKKVSAKPRAKKVLTPEEEETEALKLLAGGLNAGPAAESFGSRPNPLAVGSAMHALFEHAHVLNDFVWDAREDAFTPSFIEGLRLFRAFIDKHGLPADYLQLTEYGAELQMPADNDEFAALSIELEFGGPVTGKLDFYGKRADGTYIIVDWKSAARFNPKTHQDYITGIQQCFYINLWKLLYPERPLAGMMFVEITKDNPTQVSTHFAPADSEHANPDRIREIVAKGLAQLAANNKEEV